MLTVNDVGDRGLDGHPTEPTRPSSGQAQIRVAHTGLPVDGGWLGR